MTRTKTKRNQNKTHKLYNETTIFTQSKSTIRLTINTTLNVLFVFLNKYIYLKTEIVFMYLTGKREENIKICIQKEDAIF